MSRTCSSPQPSRKPERVPSFFLSVHLPKKGGSYHFGRRHGPANNVHEAVGKLKGVEAAAVVPVEATEGIEQFLEGLSVPDGRPSLEVVLGGLAVHRHGCARGPNTRTDAPRGVSELGRQGAESFRFHSMGMHTPWTSHTQRRSRRRHNCYQAGFRRPPRPHPPHQA